MTTIKTNGAIRNAALAVLFLSLIICIAIIGTAVEAAPPLPGAIFTTDSTCTGVDLNIYSNKADVYLDGGPAHPGAASLPDGSYYVQVTDPGGSCVLGTSVGALNQTPFVVSGGVANCLKLCTALINGPTGDGTVGNCPTSVDSACGYNDTTNPGGEYKVWVSTVSTFDNNSTKTDNFKVQPSVEPTPTPTPACETTICVNKFYDSNGNGVQDPGEPNIPGWRYCVVGTNNFSNTRLTFDPPRCMVVDPDTYNVYEDTPIEANWVHSTPISVQFALAACDSHPVSFGNFCVGPGGGLTLGFWSNKNGQKLENASDFTLLTSLCLRNANGSNKDFAGTLTGNKTALNSWLLGASATNMDYMLSAQLAAMELNVSHGFVNGSALIYEPCLKNFSFSSVGFPAGFPTGVISINNLMTVANTLLCNDADGVTLSGDPIRDEMECVKNALDHANNNLNFIQAPGTCPFTFGDDTCPFTNP